MVKYVEKSRIIGQVLRPLMCPQLEILAESVF